MTPRSGYSSSSPRGSRRPPAAAEILISQRVMAIVEGLGRGRCRRRLLAQGLQHGDGGGRRSILRRAVGANCPRRLPRIDRVGYAAFSVCRPPRAGIPRERATQHRPWRIEMRSRSKAWSSNHCRPPRSPSSLENGVESALLRAPAVVTASLSASGSSDLIGLVAVHGIACGALARSQPVAIRIARSPAPSFSSAVTLARPSSTAATGGGSRTTTRKTSTPARGSGRRRRSGNQIMRPRAGNRASAHSYRPVLA